MIRVGILGLARREGTFGEVGLRSWEEAGCAAVEQALMTHGEGLYTVHRPLVVRGLQPELERILRDWCDVPNEQARCHLILTVGGTGYTRLDIMPDAAAAVILRPAPGLAERLRRINSEPENLHQTLSRGVAGLRKQTLIVNLPGQAMGMADGESLALATQTLLPLLPPLLAEIEEEAGS